MRTFAKLILLVILIFISCSKDKNKTNDYLVLLALAKQSAIYESADCQKDYTLNPAYTALNLSSKYTSDLKQYKNVWLGDSSVKFSEGFSGFHDPENTQINAVPGDTLCDYVSRFRISIKTEIPQNLIIQTKGGNDFLRQYSDSVIVEAFTELHTKVKARFPNTKICYVEVHRTVNAYANSARLRLTPQFKTISNGAYWVNVDSCFSDPVTTDQLPDGIHFSAVTALCVKNQIQVQCGVQL